MAGPVIITRAEPGNSETAARVEERGLPYLKAPMLTLQASGHELPDLSGVQGVLFTSANGVRAFCAASERRDVTAWCVGPATLEEARSSGFTVRKHGDGNAQDLAELVIGQAAPEAGTLLHVANSAAAGNLADTLRGAGFETVFAPLYDAVATFELAAPVQNALRGGAACAVLIHSAKGAEAFGALTKEADCAGHHLVAVSAAAARPLMSRTFEQVHLAERPNEEALMAALFKAYSTL